jgi:hypothetical protein
MFPKKPSLQKLMDNLFGYATSLKRGDVMEHDIIITILGVDPHEDYWDYCVGKVRKRLELERGISTWPENGVGYRLCSEDEQLDIPGRRQLRARRQIRRGLASVEALPIENLTTHQQLGRAMQIDKMKRMDRTITSEMRTNSVLLAPRECNPRVR